MMDSRSGINNNKNEQKYGQKEWIELFSKVTMSAFSYPFEYVKVLIQIGYEPLPPRPTRTLFGRRALALPGAFRYMKHIRSIDGITGLYRGVVPKICTNLVSGYVTAIASDNFPVEMKDEDELDESEREYSEEQRIMRFIYRTLRDTFARSISIVASHPFHVITIRTMAEFAGREQKYNGIFSSLGEIWREEGIKGYFVGLIPRFVGEILTMWIARSAAFFINNYVIQEKSMRGYVNASMLYITSVLTYPFSLVCNVLAVNDCGLVVGLPPNMPIYTNWLDCWSQLSASGQLKRGSSILWRYYHGPYILDKEGNPSYIKSSSFRSPK